MIDLVLYSGEADLLALRLATLAPYVSSHGVVEALETFSGIAKRATLAHEVRFADHRSRIRCLTPSPRPFPSPWEREAYHRNCLEQLLADLPPPTLVLIGDVDELPNPADLSTTAERLPETAWGPMAVFEQSHRAYDARNVRRRPWRGTIITTAEAIRRLGAENVRALRRAPIPIAGGGWHLTHMGGLERLKAKIAAFSHQEYNTPDHLDALGERMALGKDPFGRNDEGYDWIEDASLPVPLAMDPDAFPTLWRDRPPAPRQDPVDR